MAQSAGASGAGQPEPAGPTPRATRLARARAGFRQAFTALLRPKGLPPAVSDRLEAAFGAMGRERAGGRGRIRRMRERVRTAPPQLLDWMSGQVLLHPAPLYDRESVEQLSSQQTRSIATAVGALQVALVTAAAASTLEGGPVLALAIDGVIGQVASVVHGTCDWYNTGSYLVRRLRAQGIVAEGAEVRRLTNAALMSKGTSIDARTLSRSTELRLVRGWVRRGVVDALPFGARLGHTSVRATDRIEHADLRQLVALLRSGD